MEVSVSKIMERVRVLLDQNEEQSALLEDDVDQLTLDDIIRSRIETAARNVVLNAPLYMVGELGTDTPWGDNQSADEHITWSSRTLGDGRIMYWGQMPLPENVVRFVRLKMSGWERCAHEGDVVEENTPDFERQFNSKWLGLIGNAHDPVVCIRSASSGKELLFFSCTSKEETVEEMMVIPRPCIQVTDEATDDTTTLTIPEGLFEAVCYNTAGLTMEILGKNAEPFYTVAKELLS